MTERLDEGVPMGSFGENLRREREMRGVSIEEISSATKIGVRFLEALENEEFEKLPGGIFNRSFIRSYARYLGLNEEPVLAEYQLLAGPKSDLDLNRLSVARPLPKPEGLRAPWMALAAAAVLLAAGYALFRYSQRATDLAANPSSPPHLAPTTAPAATPPPSQPATVSGSASAPAPTQVAPGVGQPAASPNTSRTTNPPAAGPEPATPRSSSPAPDSDLVLQVAATDKSWVAVDADGRTVLQRVMSPSEIQTFKAKESFDVTTGNAQGIVLTLNGETLKPLGRSGEVKSIHLTFDDVKKPSP